MATAKNVTDGPLIIDAAGRVLGAGEFGDVDLDKQPGKDHLAAGRLVEPQEPEAPAATDSSTVKRGTTNTPEA